MDELTSRDLKKAAYCQTAAQFDFGQEKVRTAVSRPLTIYSIVTETIKGLLRKQMADKLGDAAPFDPAVDLMIDASEVDEIIDSAGQLSDSEFDEEDKAVKKSCSLMVSNWAAFYFGRTPVLVNDKVVHVQPPYADDIEVVTKPDVVYDDGQTIEVVYIKTGSHYTMADEFLSNMYNGILYGRTLVPAGETRQIVCTYAEVKQAKKQSIVDELWPLPAGVTSELDDKAKAEYEELIQGTHCEGNDCKYCPGRFECQYKAPALALDIEKVLKAKKVLLSEDQKKVVAFGL